MRNLSTQEAAFNFLAKCTVGTKFEFYASMGYEVQSIKNNHFVCVPFDIRTGNIYRGKKTLFFFSRLVNPHYGVPKIIK